MFFYFLCGLHTRMMHRTFLPSSVDRELSTHTASAGLWGCRLNWTMADCVAVMTTEVISWPRVLWHEIINLKKKKPTCISDESRDFSPETKGIKQAHWNNSFKTISIRNTIHKWREKQDLLEKIWDYHHQTLEWLRQTFFIVWESHSCVQCILIIPFTIQFLSYWLHYLSLLTLCVLFLN